MAAVGGVAAESRVVGSILRKCAGCLQAEVLGAGRWHFWGAGGRAKNWQWTPTSVTSLQPGDPQILWGACRRNPILIPFCYRICQGEPSTLGCLFIQTHSATESQRAHSAPCSWYRGISRGGGRVQGDRGRPPPWVSVPWAEWATAWRLFNPRLLGSSVFCRLNAQKVQWPKPAS